jgi:hypothetical protein
MILMVTTIFIFDLLFLEACLRIHKGTSKNEIEEQIAEYLKHAPNKAGGSRHKVYFCGLSSSCLKDI